MAKFNNSSSESQTELERFKTDIDLVGYLTRKEGYKVDPKITSNATTGLINEETGSKIFVKVLTNNQQIFSDKKAPLGTGTSQGGSIIDYVKNYKNITNLGEVRKILRQELNDGSLGVPYSQMENRPKRKEVPAYSQEYFNFTPILKSSYLNSRGISNETINSPAFAGRVGEKLIKSSNADKIYTSTVFPMYEKLSEKVVGLEVKNEFYSGSFNHSNKKESFWKSNPPINSEGVKVFIGESPIDALSHFQLKNKDNKLGLLYISTLGEVGGDSERLKILTDYLEKRDNKISGYILGNDNDSAGVRYNINIIGNANVKESDITIKVIAEADQHYARISVISDDPKKLSLFEKDANKANNQLPLTTDHNMQYRNFNTAKLEDGKFKLTFLMNNRYENLLPIEKLAIKHRNSPFVVERSIQKDFSKDLEDKLGIVRTEVSYVHTDGKNKSYSVWKKGEKKDDVSKDKTNEGFER